MVRCFFEDRGRGGEKVDGEMFFFFREMGKGI